MWPGGVSAAQRSGRFGASACVVAGADGSAPRGTAEGSGARANQQQEAAGGAQCCRPSRSPLSRSHPSRGPSYAADGPVAAAEALVLAAWAPKGSALADSFAKKRAEAPAGEEKGKGKEEKKKHKAAEAPLVRQCLAHGSPVPCQACSACSSAAVKKGS